MTVPPWLKGIRGRLTAVFAAATLVVAVLGWVVLTAAVDTGLRASADGVLRARADTLAADVAASNLEQSDAPPRVVRGARTVRDVQAFSAVYSPSGVLVEASPNVLPEAPLSARPVAGTTSRSFGGLPFRVLTSLVAGPGGTWTVVAGVGVQGVAAESAALQAIVAAGIPVVTLLSAAGAWVLAGAALRPVDRMRRDAERLGEHDPAGRVGVPATRDSLADLATTLNALLDRLHHSLGLQRDLVADAGHELRTPLAVLDVELATALRPGRSRADLVDSIEHARVAVAHLCTLADDLLLLAQADGGNLTLRPGPTDVAKLIDDVVRSHVAAAALEGVTVTAVGPDRLFGQVDPTALRRVLDNLLSNAVRHAARPGVVRVEYEAATDTVALRILDDGAGFPADFLPHAFDRFRRADPARSRWEAGSGSGLGLAIAASLVSAQGGTIQAANGPAERWGAIVTVQLPTTHRDHVPPSGPVPRENDSR